MHKEELKEDIVLIGLMLFDAIPGVDEMKRGFFNF